MIEINLIPERIKKKRKMLLVYFGAGAVVAALAGILVFIVVSQNKEIARIDREIRKVEAESATLRDKIEEVIRFRQLEESYNRKRAIIDKLALEQAVWPKLLDAISEYTLPDMWLQSISQEREKDEGVLLNLSGYSLSKVIVADFVKRLEQSPEVTDIKAARIAESIDPISGVKVVVFDLQFLYKK